MIEKRISLEAWQHNGKMPPPTLLVQGESLGRSIYMRLLSGGVPIDLSGATVTFYFKKPSGLEEYLPAAIENEAEGEIVVEMTSQSCAEAGEIRNTEVRISFADGKNARILGPRLMIEEGMNDDAILSSNEYLALDEALQEVEGLMGSVMKKEVYDTNNNGIVDNSEKLGGETAAWYQDKITALESGLTNTEEKVAGLSNPNLLINGGFTVWQRGESFTVGTSRIYTADRWYCVKLAGGAESATVSRTEDGMLVSGATVSIAYMLEPQDVAMLAGKQLTLSIGVKNSDGSMKYIARPAEVTGAMVSLGGFTAGQTVCWAKLEMGEEATPFVPRSYGEELLACMRYYQKTGTVFCPGYITVGGASFTYMPPAPMRSVPTIGGNVNDMTVRPVDSDVIYQQTVGISSSQSSGDTLYLTTTAPGVTSNRPCVVQFWGLTLDAEVYS